jgi:hypothetical protein
MVLCMTIAKLTSISVNNAHSSMGITGWTSIMEITEDLYIEVIGW